MMPKIRSYRELRRILTFEERFKYLSLKGSVGESTFGFDRYLNQNLYRSREWKRTRYIVIERDQACDLGIAGYEIEIQILIHHMNPISIEDIESGNPDIFDPEFLICTTYNTHRAIHFGDESLLPKPPIVRRPNDTTLWR
jgi:hypothetical protein